MSEVYFDAAEVERTRRRAEQVGQLTIGDTWMRERMTPEEVARSHEEFGGSEPSLWGNDQFERGGWLPDATAASAVLAALPIVDRQPGWTFGTYVFRDRLGGYGITFARPIGTRLRSREELEADVRAGREPRLDNERGAEMVLRWDPLDLAGYLWGSIAARELKQLGGDWHGLWWSTEYFVGGVGTPVIAGGEESSVSETPPDLAAFSFQAEAPSRWDPSVRRSADGEVSFEFFTFGARHGERLWRHRDVYSPGSTVPERSRTEIARGGFGYVF